MPDFLAEQLAKPENSGYLRSIKAAQEWGREPSYILFGTHHNFPDEQVEHMDRQLMEASYILDTETCKSCGTPSWLGKSTDSYLQFEVQETTCYACQTLEEDRSKSKESKPGVTKYVTPEMAFGGELPTRADYIERLMRDQ